MKYPRKCDITNKGMNKGFCIGDGQMYIKTRADMIRHIAKETDYKSLNEAFNDEYYYYTTWEELDEEGYYTAEGKFIETI